VVQERDPVAQPLGLLHEVVSIDGLRVRYGDTVAVDGVGFVCPAAGAPSAARADGGFGLTAMRQRVEGVAGVLQIESEPEAGTAEPSATG
jgi:signal transduction histidine kinase